MVGPKNYNHKELPHRSVLIILFTILFTIFTSTSANTQHQPHNNHLPRDSLHMPTTGTDHEGGRYNCDNIPNPTPTSEAERKYEEEWKKVCVRSHFMRDVQRAAIQTSILEALNISNPNATVPKYVEPDSERFIHMKQLVENEQKFLNEPKHKEVFIKPEFTQSLEENERKMSFTIRRDVYERSIKLAFIYVFIRKPVNPDPHYYSWLLVYNKDVLVVRFRFKLISNNIVNRWHKVDVTQNLQDFLRGREEVLRNTTTLSNPPPLDPDLDVYRIDILCMDHDGNSLLVKRAKIEEEKEKLPILKIQIRDAVLSRLRRDMTGICDSSSSYSDCCRYSLQVDFEELGWDWVVYPKRFTMYYCSGDCQFTQGSYHENTKYFLNSTRAPGMVRCCSPKRFSPVSMIYRSTDDKAFLTKINDLLVEKCDCR